MGQVHADQRGLLRQQVGPPDRPIAVGYGEHRPPAGLAALVACTWDRGAPGPRATRIVPDGCVDLVFKDDGELQVAGPDTGARTVVLPAGAQLTGIRLRPGAAGRVLGLPASELRDRQVGAEAIWGDAARRLAEALEAVPPAVRPRLLVEAVAARQVEGDALVAAAWRHLGAPGARVAAVAAELGVGERHLHRRVVAAVGYGPKMLGRVARLRRLVATGPGPLAWRALEAGYASQAHMGDEVRRLTGTTPVRFLEDAALTAA